jgi:hypothetical protein
MNLPSKFSESENTREYRQRYREEHREYFKEKSKQDKRNNPTAGLLSKAKANAKERGLECTITKDDIVIPTFCPYLGCVLTNTQGQGLVRTNISIDRINSSLGYVPGNVQVISLLANRMKNDASVEELISFAKGVINQYGS